MEFFRVFYVFCCYFFFLKPSFVCFFFEIPIGLMNKGLLKFSDPTLIHLNKFRTRLRPLLRNGTQIGFSAPGGDFYCGKALVYDTQS